MKKLIDDLNGDIQVDSAPDQGSRFNCRIPLNQLPNHVHDTTKNALTTHYSCDLNLKQTGHHKKILLVEDDLIAQKVNVFLLKKLGCLVDTAQTANDTLQKNLYEYDLIITDIGLPDMDGFALTKAIRKKLSNQNKPVPIVGLTAHMNPSCEKEAAQAGLDWITTKPLTQEMINAL